jgi:hypothetical protein
LDKEQTIDSIFTTQKKMELVQDKIYKTIKNNPLKDKKYGIELNPFRLLYIGKDWGALSGGFSIFNNKKKTEQYFSVFMGGESKITYEFDYRYRYYLGNSINGFYISAFARFTHLEEKLWFNTHDYQYNSDRFGIGFGIGYKKFSYNGLYWGINLGLGRYFIEEKDPHFTSSMILIFEILKIGWAF